MFKNYILAFLLGCVTALSMPGFDVLWLQFVGFSGFIILFFSLLYSPYPPSVLRSGFLGWFYGFGYFVVGLYWIGNSLLVDGNSYAWAYPLAVVGLPVVLSLFWLICFAVCAYLSSYLRPCGLFLVVIFLFSLTELSREFLFTGFPWNYFVYGWNQMDSMLQILSVIGLHGLNLLVVFALSVPALLFFAFKFSKMRIEFLLLTLCTLVCVVCVYVWGDQRLIKDRIFSDKDDKPVQIVLVQPNIEQSIKWEQDYIDQHFDSLIDLSKVSNFKNYDPSVVTIIVWPETALHYSFYRNEDYYNKLRQILSGYEGEVFLLTGVLTYEILWEDGDRKPLLSNAVSIFDKQMQEIGRYNKSHLVPFGEYIPFNRYIPIAPIAKFNNLNRGKGLQYYQVGNISVLPLICYEAIFSHEVSSGMSDGVTDFLVSITNDGWYGDSAGPYQHFVIARYRAIENERPLIRVANTGISGYVDKYGNVIETISLFSKSSVLLKVVTD